MAIMIQLSPEQENRLRAYAESQQQTPEEVAQLLVTREIARLPQQEPALVAIRT